MTLSRHTSRIYMDAFDLHGAVNVGVSKAREALTPMDSSGYWTYMGAAHALNIIANHDHIETQETFWKLFDQSLPDYETNYEKEWE